MQGLVKSSMILVLMLLMFLRLLKKNIKQEAFFLKTIQTHLNTQNISFNKKYHYQLSGILNHVSQIHIRHKIKYTPHYMLLNLPSVQSQW